MTTLTINCTLDCDHLMKRQPGALVLKRVLDFEPPQVCHEEEWTVDEAETIHTGNRYVVLRAQIIRPTGVALDAVLKIDPTGECEAACKNELKVYQTKGRRLQGTALPEFYGCFQVRIGAAMVTCLAMEHCGEPLEKDFDKLDPTFAVKLLSVVGRFHGCGLTHGDLYPRNVRVVDDTPVLIDFESSESHTCGLRMMVIPGTTIPTPEEFGCAEMHDLIYRMSVWKRELLSFSTFCIKKDSIGSAEDIKRFIWKGYKSGWQRQRLELQAERSYKELCKERILTWGTDKVSGMCFRRLSLGMINTPSQNAQFVVTYLRVLR
ncbi:hypothetical protein B0H15DRAFT_249934 [Mycena belliarum]|uniref:Protein kinase domain-containing protein n=1 Tax=Mycena belliarum TaxID=1033014 RepID=A0AAD6U6T7_9AGAR|nr:hypothetical protein B0H15DRAFT_249934 [Mycena belliae]